MTDVPPRYRKQALFAGIGADGQRRLCASRVLVVGCGALGSVIADQLVRSGVGFVRIVDRDFVDLSNLQRQILYDEQDVSDQLPKAIAAARKLRRINSSVTVEPIVADAGPANILSFFDGVDLVLDGTDNFEVRFLINDASLETGIPWINGGCIGSHGQVMVVFPGETGCLRCLMGDVPDPGSMETCDTAGVIAPAVNVVASLQMTEALKLLSGRRELIEPRLTIVDIWDGTYRRLNIGELRNKADCPACLRGERLWLRGERGARTTVLCGRNAVQVLPAAGGTLPLAELAKRLRSSGEVSENPFLVRLRVADPRCELTIFADGRAIITGTEDLSLARALYARYVGN
jgi:adenylyltransferase/sulfurtransferase